MSNGFIYVVDANVCVADIIRYTWVYPTSYYDFVPSRQNRCEFLKHFMTVRFIINFRTLGNMFLSFIYHNISIISWRSVLLVEETDKHYHIMLYTSPWSRFELTTSVVIGTDCIQLSYYDFVLNRQNRCKFLRHFMTVRFVINFRTLGNNQGGECTS
jgi:hypothetical protein